jgi:hypothetical protein
LYSCERCALAIDRALSRPNSNEAVSDLSTDSAQDPIFSLQSINHYFADFFSLTQSHK